MSIESTTHTVPYAAPQHVLQLITRYRDRGLPKPLGKSDIEAMNIPSSSAFRALQTLKFLGLIEDSGYPTEQFDQLKRASNGEYKSKLTDIVRVAYATVFSLVDPSQDNMEQIQAAFRRYDPVSELNRMVNLFLGLCKEAGIISEEIKRPKTTSPRPAGSTSPTRRLQKRKPDERNSGVKHEERIPTTGEATRRDSGVQDILADYRLIVELLHRLPKNRQWTTRQRELWLGAMEANINLVVEVVNDTEQNINVPYQP